MNAVSLDVSRLMGVSAENSVGVLLSRIVQRPGRYFRRHTQPARVQAVNEPHDRLSARIELLQLEIKRSSQPAEPHVVDLKSVKLMAMNRDVPKAFVIP